MLSITSFSLKARGAFLFDLQVFEEELQEDARGKRDVAAMGQGEGAQPEAASSQGSPQIFSSALLGHSAASSLPEVHLFVSFSLKLSSLPLSMETLPPRGMLCALVQVSLESPDGDGEGVALTSPPALCVPVLSVSLPAGTPQHFPPPNVGFPCAESVSLPTQHLTRWS